MLRDKTGFSATMAILVVFCTLWLGGVILFISANSQQLDGTADTEVHPNRNLNGDQFVSEKEKEATPNPHFCEPWPSCVLPARAPQYQSLCDILDAWSPNDPNVPPNFPRPSTLLPRFDYSNDVERGLAERYRVAELPFLVHNIPELTATGTQWGNREYMRNMFASKAGKSYKITQSLMTSSDDPTHNNTFLYYSPNKFKQYNKRGGSFSLPQVERSELNYEDFDEIVERAQTNSLKESEHATTADGESALFYTTISAGAGKKSDWVRDALPFLVGDGSKTDPPDSPTLFIPYPSKDWKGINCRFGMKGVVQTAHYDGGRNMIAMVVGSKRYMLSPPQHCEALELLPPKHPSARHASFDWADPNERARRKDGEFCEVETVDLVLEEGEVLYVPSFWFHYIVSLERSMQCNSRSGKSFVGKEHIDECGF